MGLNQQQLEAVKQLEGPLLILAGAGSGKTTTATKRYEHLLELGVASKNILMVTFTRKAANEMMSRIRNTMPHLDFKDTWVDTFHRICMDMLRADGQFLGVPTDFSVCNNYESKKILDDIIKRHNLSGGSDEEEATITKENTFEYISNLKTLLISPNALLKNMPTLQCMNWEKSSAFLTNLKEEQSVMYEALKIVYPEYQKELLTRKLLDFEDIMFYAVCLLDKKPDVSKRYQEQFIYIMVDEFQDTNHVQFKLVELLAGEKQNICVVGDDFQSVYGFRGAEIENILEFEKHFPGTKIIKLEQNYRSTKRIVEFSNEIIQHNKNQKKKNMFSEKELGDKIQIFEALDDEHEAKLVAKEILALKESNRFEFNDIAVLFRNNSHASKFAKVFAEHKIPLQITGDTEFADRVEVRDMLAYLKLLENPEDVFSLRRIINKPKRGIGPKAAEFILGNAQGNIYEFLILNQVSNAITKAGQQGIQELISFFDTCSRTLQEQGIGAAIEQILKEINYEKRVYEKSFSWMQEEVAEGLNELIRLANKAEKEQGRMSIESFHEYLKDLYIDQDSLSPKVTLMTVHKSKGLEFPVVFVTGLDNLTFPNEQKEDFEKELEEERRVFYVAATRAKELLYGSYCRKREKRVEGTMQELEADKSLFLQEVWNSEHIEVKK
ncbi:ATP-dependent helicase [Bacillus thuringiensis]|nr:ATP-dependent helicase [Bacillus thuringiensis]